jgi:hypothetical protein
LYKQVASSVVFCRALFHFINEAALLLGQTFPSLFHQGGEGLLLFGFGR